ncbi:MAG: HutD family protein [Steroidobacteraceae bacterium]
MPWKNGGGETFEIAVSPPGASLDSMDWRISMAIVAADGPFSSFPGVDRTLSILEGRGMELDLGTGHGNHVLTRKTGPLHFPADIPATARLIGGAVTDLNVMTRRSRYTHAVTRHLLQGCRTFDIGAAEAALFCCAGAVSCALPSGDTAVMQARDCVLFRTPPGRVVLTLETTSVLLLAELRRITA